MIVYLISNLVTGHVYVGQTAQTLEKRWRQHLYTAFHRKRGTSKSRLLPAIRKFGAQAFSIRRLWEDKNGSYDEMNKLEQGYIRAFDSTNPRLGYNIHPGWTPPNGGKHRTRKSNDGKVKRQSQ
jgi:group I intron endonuclease